MQNSLRSWCATRLVADHDLDDAAGLAQVDEGDAAVVAAAGHPAGQGHGLARVLGTQRAGVVGADHCVFLRAGRCPGGSGSAAALVAAADVLDLAAPSAGEPDVRDAAALGVPDLLAELLRARRPPRWRCRGGAARSRRPRWPARDSSSTSATSTALGTFGPGSRTPSANSGIERARDAEADADAGVRRPAVAREGVVPAAAADRLQPLVARHEDLEDGAGVVVEAAGDPQVGLDGDVVVDGVGAAVDDRRELGEALVEQLVLDAERPDPLDEARCPATRIVASSRQRCACSVGGAGVARPAARPPRRRAACRACRSCRIAAVTSGMPRPR